jgi:hypothetical protein
MINFYKQVPTIYSSASRDFQYLSWLINVVLNSVKHNIDDIYYLPSSKTDSNLAELLALTLGFKVRRNYDQTQLISLASIIPSILKNKGSLRAVQIAGNALVRSSGSTGIFDVTVEDGQLEVIFPKELVDITLFMDILPYILPAGMSCRVIRKTLKDININTIVDYTETVYGNTWVLSDLSIKDNRLVGMSDLSLGSTTQPPVFINYIVESEHEGDTTKYTPNIGLLSNTVIPVLEDSFRFDNDDGKLKAGTEESTEEKTK